MSVMKRKSKDIPTTSKEKFELPSEWTVDEVGVNDEEDSSDSQLYSDEDSVAESDFESSLESDETEDNVDESDGDDEEEGDYDPEENGGEESEQEEVEDEEERSEDEKVLESNAEETGKNSPLGFREKTKTVSNVQVNEYDEYDTSDEEDIRNTVGNIPMNWYNEYRHLGYDWDGNKIGKPESGDRLDSFLKRIEDPDFWRTVKDPQTGADVVLNEEDLKLIKRIQAQKIPEENFDEYAPWIEWFTSEVMKTPVRKFPEHKRSFLPSKHEARQVSRLVHALKMGWIKTKEEQDRLRAQKEPQFYDLWASESNDRGIHKHIPAPKRLLPGHSESYNPPAEYLFDAKEMKRWNKEFDPWKRKQHFVPQKYESLRNVPAYGRYVYERFLRCMDLYLCPRAYKMKLTITPEDLVPKLPSPRDLQPFPTVLAVEYLGHTDMVRSISIDKSGQYLVSGSDDRTCKIWEVNTGRCLKTIQTEGVVRCVEWCPNASLSLILIASDNNVILLNPHLGDYLICNKTDTLLSEGPKAEIIVSERVKTTVTWKESEGDERNLGFRLVLHHFKEVSQVTWHGKGDYFASVMPDGQNRSVLISQVSKRRSQLPFTKPKGLVQHVLFHPSKPFLFVATQRHVRIYDLLNQTLVKKLMSNSKWISTMAVHPGGDNLLVGTYDRKVLWFDLDLSTKPYQTLRLHGTAVRGVAYHKRYPLFATGSDDRSLIVSHGMVYNDLLKNPLIVPLKRLEDHKPQSDFGIFDVLFHPLQPWVFSAGADGSVKLYSN